MLNTQLGSLMNPAVGIQGGRGGKQKKTKSMLDFLLAAAKQSLLTDAVCYSFSLDLNSKVNNSSYPGFSPLSPQGFGSSLFLLI